MGAIPFIDELKFRFLLWVSSPISILLYHTAEQFTIDLDEVAIIIHCSSAASDFNIHYSLKIRSHLMNNE